MECPNIMIRDEWLNRPQLKTAEEILAHTDCWIFKSFVCFCPPHYAKNIMSAMKEGHEEEQVNTIHLRNHFSELNQYKPFQRKPVSEQFRFSRLKIEEEINVLTRIDS